MIQNHQKRLLINIDDVYLYDNNLSDEYILFIFRLLEHPITTIPPFEEALKDVLKFIFRLY